MPLIFGDKEHFVLSGDVVAPDEYDYDWTDTLDKTLWSWLNNKRYEIMKEALLSGESVQFISGGNSLIPYVYSGDTCFLHPIVPGKTSNILPGDIVFCAVQDGDRYYVHLVWRVLTWETNEGVKKQVYVIGNNKPEPNKKCNGWSYREHIFGLLVKTERGSHVPERVEIFD